ncbi:MAG: ABC transporter permease, partial [Chloroflexota bacterium]
MTDIIGTNLPVDPPVQEHETPASESFYTATQWQLTWWRFRRHKLAVSGATVLGILILMAAFADFVAPVSPTSRSTTYVLSPP